MRMGSTQLCTIEHVDAILNHWQSGQVLSSPTHAPTVLMPCLYVTRLLEEANGSVVVASQGVWR